MKIIQPYAEILTPVDRDRILKDLERFGRVCYKSEDKISPGSAGKFVRALIRRGHESVLEHVSVSVLFVCDRGISHELVRHRIASFSQESTRYCNYSKEGFGSEITVIEPFFFKRGTDAYQKWEEAMRRAERAYFDLLKLGASPQEARSVLPNSLKTEVVMTANIRQWRHFFDQRTAPDAHPQMCQITIPLLYLFKEYLPDLFYDISVEETAEKEKQS